MSFRITNRRAVAAGLILSLIFITVSTANFASGAEPQTPQVEKRSRLHPKRIWGGLKRGVSKIFGRSKSEPEQTIAEEPVKTMPPVGQQIDRQYAAQPQLQPQLQPRPIGPPQPELQPLRPTQLPATAARQPLPQRQNIVRHPDIFANSQPQPQPQVVHSIRQPRAQRPPAQKIADVKIDTDNPFAGIDFGSLEQGTAAQPKRTARTQPTRTVQKPATVVRQTISRVAEERRGAPEIAHMLGYCPVNLRAGKFQRGKPEYRHVYQDRTYKFDSQAAMDEFIRNPQPYAPVMQGIDVIELQRTGRRVEGYLSFSCDYNGRFYLFRTAENQEAFLADPAKFGLPE